MTKIISYSLFTARQNPVARSYDPHETNPDRYWFNLPSLVVANRLAYPEYKIRLHIEPGIQSHRLFNLIPQLENAGLIETRMVHLSYRNTEPTVWRMMPLWDGDVDVMLCRDVDSIPNSPEIRATTAFEQSNFIIQNIRSHPHHNSHLTIMLAGLCAFKGQNRQHINHSFDAYYAMCSTQWGCDQSLLAHYWVDRTGTAFVKDCILDTAISCIGPMCEHISGFDAGKLDQSKYDSVNLEYIDPRVLAICDSITSWPGQPVDSRHRMKELLDLDIDVCRQVKGMVSDFFYV